MPVVTRVLRSWLHARDEGEIFMSSSTAPDLVLQNGRITTLDPARPEARSVGDQGWPHRRHRRCEHGVRGPADDGRRSRGAARHPRPQRLASPRDPRRPLLQPGAALGRRAVARRRAADAEGAGRAHAAAALGAGDRRLERVAVRRATHADARRAQQGGARDAGRRASPLRLRAAEPRRAARARLRFVDAESARRPRRARCSRRADGAAHRRAERVHSLLDDRARAEARRSTISSTRRDTSCAS